MTAETSTHLSALLAPADDPRRSDHEYFHVAGPATGRPIVFVHATRVDRTIWTPQEAELSSRFRIVALDLPGHGVLRDHRFRLDAAVDGLLEVITWAAGGRALVVGLSLGGYVAMELAARRPEAVAGLIVSGATAQPGARVPVLPRAIARTALGLEACWPRQATRTLAGTLPLPSLQATRGVRWLRLDPGVQGILEIVGRRFTRAVAEYPGPVVFVNGERDRVFRRGEREFLAASPRASLEVIPDAGHQCNVDNPELFNRIVRRMADSVEWRLDIPA